MGDADQDGPGLPLVPFVEDLHLGLAADAVVHPRFQRGLQAGVRQARLLTVPPWVRSLRRDYICFLLQACVA